MIVSKMKAFTTSSLTCKYYNCCCNVSVKTRVLDVEYCCRVTGGELFEDIVAREFYSEADAR
jgi:hypothetical protein